MKIKNNSRTRELFDAEILEEPVQFDDKFTASVDKQTAAKLVDKYDDIEYIGKVKDDNED